MTSFTFIMESIGPDVILRGSGSINLAGLSFKNTGNSPTAVVVPSDGIIIVNGASDFYSGFTGPSSFGSGGEILGKNPLGHPVSVQPGNGLLGVPQGYVSGDTLSNEMTFAGATYASLGVMPGTYVWTWASDSLILEVVSLG